MKKFGKIFGIVFVLYGIPCVGFGAVWVTEIHYNPDGADGGYEWVEWWNNSDDTIDISEYVFRENNVNHGLKKFQGNLEIEPHDYGVVADNPGKFKDTFPDYDGVIVDSAFSLNNTGELLEVVNAHGSVVFEVTYGSDSGGDGNGHSIGLINDVWQEVSASPGQENTILSIESNEQSQDESVNTSPTDTSPTTTPEESLPATYIEIKNPDYTEKTIKVDAGGDRIVMAGVSYWFSGIVYGLQGGVIDEPNVRWNWGDGNTGTGPVERHTYRYPGTYTLTMVGIAGNYSDRDRVTITVIEPSIILGVDQYDDELLPTITNSSIYTLELSGYRVVGDNNTFIFPEDSFINPGQTMVLDRTTTGITVFPNSVLHVTDGEYEEISQVEVAPFLLSQQVKAQQEITTNQEYVQDSDVTDTSIARGTHSVAFIDSSPLIDQNIVPDPASVVSRSEQYPVYSTQENQHDQSALMLQATQENNISWHVWGLIILGLLLLGTYIMQRRKDSMGRDGIRHIEIID